MFDQQQVTSHVIKGLILSLVIIIFGLIVYFTGQTTNKALGYVQYVLLMGGIIYSCILFSNQKNGEVSFGEVFSHGFKIATVVAAITCVYTIVSLKFIFPEMIDIIMRESRKAMEEKKLSDADIDNALQMMKNNFIPFAIAGILFMFALIGAISAAIGAAVAKKKPQNPFENQA